MGLKHLDTVIPHTVPTTNTMVLATSTDSMLATRLLVIRTIVLGLSYQTITATTITTVLAQNSISMSAISTVNTSVQTIALVSSLLVATVTTLLVPITNTLVLVTNTESISIVRTVVPGLGHQKTISATTTLAYITPISVPAISTGKTSVQTIALVSSLLVATVTTLLVPITNTTVFVIYSSNMSLVGLLVMGLGHQKTISATTTLAHITSISVHAISTGSTSVQTIALVSNLLVATVTTLLVPTTNTLVPAIYTSSMLVVRAIVPGLGHQTISATTTLAQITPISVHAISTANTSENPAIAQV